MGPVEELVAAGVVKLLARHEGMGADELLAAAHRSVGALGTLTHSSTDGLLEISATGVSKATGLASLAEEHGIGAADVVAFGDMPNDLPMLAWAGRGIAVANAHAEVLALADEVTGSVEDDGVAAYLSQWF
jgi:hydroxymethylpyrimidine pyrophosphatase-like HAD family hydrolase